MPSGTSRGSALTLQKHHAPHHGGGGGDLGSLWPFGGFVGFGVGVGVGSGVGVGVGSANGAGVSVGGGDGVLVGIGLGVSGGDDPAAFGRVDEASAMARAGRTTGTSGSAVAGAGLADGWNGV